MKKRIKIKILDIGTEILKRLTVVSSVITLALFINLNWETIFALTNNWGFTSSGDYTFDSSKIEVAGNIASLLQIDQTDDDNSTNGFGGGTNDNTDYNVSYLEIDNILASPDPMPDAAGSNNWIDMFGNIFLAHMNDSPATNGDTVSDSAILNYDGFLTTDNGATDKSVTGLVGNAIDFDGTGDYVDVVDISGDILSDTPFTYCTWAKGEGVTGYQKLGGVLNDNNIPTEGFALYTDIVGTTMRMVINDSITSDPNEFVLNEWYHWCIAYDSAVAYLYRNGESVASVSTSYTAPTTKFGIGNIGSDAANFSSFQGWNGLIDEVALWNRYLEPYEIASIYREQNETVDGTFLSRVIDAGDISSWEGIEWTTSFPALKALPDNNLAETAYSAANADMTQSLGLYHLDASSGADSFSDTSLSLNNLACSGSTCPTAEVSGVFQTALEFDGTDDYISTDMDGTSLTDLTVEFWMKPNANTNPNGIFHWADAPASGLPFILLRGNSATESRWYLDNDYRITFSHDSDKWTHIALTYDGTTWNAYANGASVGSYTGGAANQSNGTTLYFGNGFGGFYGGKLDEVAVFERELTPAEISDHYLRGAATIKYQVRSCSDPACFGTNFEGDDGTISTFYSEEDNASIDLPSLLFNPLNDNQYFQYAAYLDSDTITPQIASVNITPTRYYSDSPTIENTTGQSYSDLSQFIVTEGGGNEGTISFQISNDGINYYYHDDFAWVPAFGTETTSVAGVNSNIANFVTEVGTGSFFFKGFLESDGSQAVELDDISIEYSDSEGEPGVLTVGYVPAAISFATVSSGGTDKTRATFWQDQGEYLEVVDSRGGSNGFELYVEFEDLIGEVSFFGIDSTNYTISSTDVASFEASDLAGVSAPFSQMAAIYDQIPITVLEGDTRVRASGSWYIYPITELTVPALLPGDNYSGEIMVTVVSKQ